MGKGINRFGAGPRGHAARRGGGQRHFPVGGFGAASGGVGIPALLGFGTLHSIAGLACSATAVLIGHVAGATKTIRVGSGGVMLPNHAPLVVAEQFGTLEALYPGRIDLGLGRAPGGDFPTMRALRRDLHQGGDDFPELLEELRTYLGPDQPGQLVKAIPGQGSNVPITLLGSSTFSAQLAAIKGLPFAFAAHFAPGDLDIAAQLYRERFCPTGTLQRTEVT